MECDLTRKSSAAAEPHSEDANPGSGRLQRLVRRHWLLLFPTLLLILLGIDNIRYHLYRSSLVWGKAFTIHIHIFTTPQTPDSSGDKP